MATDGIGESQCMSEPPKGPYLGALGDVCTQGADGMAQCMCIGIVDYL